MIHVGRLAPGDQWDQNILDRLFANDLYPTGLEFTRHEGYPHAVGAVLIVPGRYWAGREADIAEAIAGYRWVLGVRASDEEDLFDITKVAHPNLRWWVQSPLTERTLGASRPIPIGFPPHFNDLGSEPPVKDVDVFLSAQNTHARRHEAFHALRRCRVAAAILANEGFAQGMAPDDYRAMMTAAKVAPAPAGPASAETFRLYEALEAHAIPVADTVSPIAGEISLWDRVFPGAPFPMYTTPGTLPQRVATALSIGTEMANRVTAWWIAEKRSLARALRADLQSLGAL